MTELEITKQKAEAGDAEAQDRLGDMYRLGTGTEKNYEEALKWYKASEAQGNISAHTELGWKAEYGIDKMCEDTWNFQTKNPEGIK